MSYPMVKTASLYNNFYKTGNYVIYDVIIWVQDAKLQKMARENFNISALYNITKNQDNPIKTGRRQVRSWSATNFQPVCDQLRTSFEPDSVMEFGFK